MAFELPDLSYAYDALEPNIDARTMEIHHSKHHNGYTTNLNNAITDTPHASQTIEEILKGLVDFAKKNDILLVNDNPYSFILNDYPFSIFNIEGADEVCLELNSLSKTFNMAGSSYYFRWSCSKCDYNERLLIIT